MVRESTVEHWLCNNLRALGCLTYKFVSPGADGVPDRLIVRPDGAIFFVELKTDVGRLSQRQKVQIDILRQHGCTVYVCYGMDGAHTIVDHIAADLLKGERLHELPST